MSAFLIPVVNRAAVEAVLGPLTAALVDDTGAVTYYIANDASGTVDSVAAAAAGAVVYPTPEDAYAATTSRPSKTDAVTTALRAKARQAIADNIAFSATVATNRQRIINATTAATAGTTATISNVAQAQSAIRNIASTLVTTLNAELAIADQAAALSQQNVALLRLMLNELDSTEGT